MSNFFKSKSLTQTLLSTCAVLLLIIIFSFVAIHMFTSRVLGEQVNINEELLSQNIIFEVDNTFYEYSNIKNLCEKDSNICNIKRTDEEMFPLSSETQYLSAAISKLQTSGRKVFLYFNDEDVIVNSTGISTLSSFLENYPLTSDIKYDIIYGKETSYHKYVTTANHSFFLYLASFENNENIKLLIMENSDTLLERLNNLRNDTDLEYIISDKFNNTILTSQKFTNILQSDILAKYYRNGTFHFDNNNYVVIQTQSQRTHLQYTIAISNHKVLSKLSFFKKTSVSIIIITTLITLFLLLLIVIQNKRPINEIIASLPSSFITTSEKNELNIIKQAISNIQSESCLAKDEVSKVTKKWENEILLKLVLNRKLSNEDMIHMSNILPEQKNGFRIVVIKLLSAENLFPGDTMTGEERAHTAMFIMKNIFDELLEGISLHTLLFDNKIIAIVQNPDNVDALVTTLSMGQDSIHTYFDINFLIAISNNVENIDKLSSGYYYAVSLLENVKGAEDTQIITTHTITYDTNDSNYCYNEGAEQNLLHALKSKQADECTRILNNIFSMSTNFPIENSLVERCAYYGVIGTILRYISSTNEHIGFADVFEQVEELLSIHNFQYGKDLLYSICSDLCAITLKSDENIFTRVSTIVADEYQNTELSVGYIAEIMNLHPVYLSSLFKAHNEYGLLEFINRFRINKAKTILTESPASIEVVAEQVGYANSKTFSRVFKKYEGISPAKYRDNANQ